MKGIGVSSWLDVDLYLSCEAEKERVSWPVNPRGLGVSGENWKS